MKNTLGVIIARMQVDQLHAGHKHLIKTVQSENDDILILIGDRDNVHGHNNPLPGHVRKIMIQEEFPHISNIEIQDDQPNNQLWSNSLDEKVNQLFPQHKATLYCSRSGFRSAYSGIHAVKEIAAIDSPSGTKIRDEILNEHVASIEGKKYDGAHINQAYRRGMIAANKSRYPIDFSCVDMAVMNEDYTKVLLGNKKTDGDKWRFIGGFVDPDDKSRKLAAIRETHEEVGMIEIGDVTHLGDIVINDFRYRDELDNVRTDFFVSKYIFGAVTASDDLDEADWFSIAELKEKVIPSHQPLADMLLKHLQNNFGE